MSKAGMTPCADCEGTGRTWLMPDGHEVECSSCDGAGVSETTADELARLRARVAELELKANHEDRIVLWLRQEIRKSHSGDSQVVTFSSYQAECIADAIEAGEAQSV